MRSFSACRYCCFSVPASRSSVPTRARRRLVWRLSCRPRFRCRRPHRLIPSQKRAQLIWRHTATVITVVLASLAAYAFARMEFKGRKFFLFIVVMTMAFPTYTTLIPMYRIMASIHLVNTYLGIILCYVSGFLPLATWILLSYMQSLPAAIEEAGSVDGASRMQVFRLIVLPLIMPAIASTGVITFLFAWAQFIFPLVLASDQSTQPLTVIVAAIQGRHVVPYSLLSTAGVIALSVPAVIALFTNRFIVSGLINGSVK